MLQSSSASFNETILAEVHLNIYTIAHLPMLLLTRILIWLWRIFKHLLIIQCSFLPRIHTVVHRPMFIFTKNTYICSSSSVHFYQEYIQLFIVQCSFLPRIHTIVHRPVFILQKHIRTTLPHPLVVSYQEYSYGCSSSGASSWLLSSEVVYRARARNTKSLLSLNIRIV